MIMKTFLNKFYLGPDDSKWILGIDLVCPKISYDKILPILPI